MFFYLLLGIQTIFALFVIYLLIRVIIHEDVSSENKQFHSISIVIPFCNESRNLPRLLESLSFQEYGGSYEIILVNDNSTDNYMQIIEKFRMNNPKIPLKLVDSCYDSGLKLTNKQQAIDTGVNHAIYDWIAFSDADMYLKKNWLKSLVLPTGSSFKFVYGHTIIRKSDKSLFNIFQAFQLEFLFSIAYAFHCSGFPGSCMGNNILISKEKYIEIGGHSGIGYSLVEDRDLFGHVRKKGLKTTVTLPFIPTAYTMPCLTFNSFFNQVLRWVKGGLKNSGNLIFPMFFLGMQNLVFFFALIKTLPNFLLITSILNACLLGFLLFVTFKKIGSEEHISIFPLYYLFLTLETLFIIIPLLILSPVWKGKRI